MSRSRPKLLIVDDVPNNIRAIKRVLEPLDIEMMGVHSGQEALMVILENDFFAVLMDVQMPEMDGFEAATLIFENPQTSHLPVIFITAISREERFASKAYKTGAVDYLTKPFDDEILLSKVNVFLKLYNKERELMVINDKLEKFTKMVSHDLKAPLRHIRYYTQAVLDENQEALPKKAVEDLNAVNKASKRLYRLIEDLLEYAQITQQDITIEEVNLSAVLFEVVEDLDGVIQKCDGQLIVGELPVIQCNRTQMRQIFQNLIGNALKYRKEKIAPVIHVNCESSDEESNMCHIVVKDNGIGFDNTFKERIFAPFERLVGMEDYEGSGIGLATVHEIVMALGGTVSADGIVGKGATFTVSLPIK